MTTVAAIQGNGWSVVGYDSRVTTVSEGGRYYTLPKKNGKVVKHGEFLIGMAGDLRAINIVTYIFKAPPIPRTAINNLDKYIIGTFLPALKDCLEDNGINTKEGSGSDFIILLRGKVYEIGEHFEWSPDTTNIYSLGSGSSYALGSMYSTLEKDFTLEEAKYSIRKSLEVASQLDPFTGNPFTVLVQKETNNLT
jgi:ATP-dependent protease HslVU (ClpYQ) peptidase subunit